MIVYWYWTIALAYVLLVLFSYIFNPPIKNKDSIHHAWKRLAVIETESKDASTVQCTNDNDCPKNFVCLDDGECVARLMRGGNESCDPQTGRMEKVKIQGVLFAVCVCLFPHLFTQKRFGSNCNVEVACGIHGRYDLKLKKCICNDGYVVEGLNCRPKTVIEQPCGDDEVDRKELIKEFSHGFHNNYLNGINADKKCFKRPCTFDALTGRPLQGSYFSLSFKGCVCDPSLGQFGVHLSIPEYTPTLGYNACASIYKDADEPTSVDIYAYFYLRDREPIVFYAFRNTSSLNPALKITSDNFIVGQKFPFDYMQFLLKKTPENVTVRTRNVQVDPLYRLIEMDNEWNYKSFASIRTDCKNIPYVAGQAKTKRAMAYDMLYAFPACFENNNVVLNPQQLSYREFPNLFRSNGLKLSYADKKWTLDLSDEPYQVHLYYDE